jgi:tRNA C32,U32 (ribose-2'-O)-methylase TrmJ
MNSSLNLAQAALIVAYELWMAANPTEHPELAQPEPRPAGAPPRWGDMPTSLEALKAALAEDQQLASGTEREEMFAALAGMLGALHPDTNESRMAYSIARLRAILLRAAPRREESGLLAHLFLHITRRIRPKDKRD